MIPGLIKHTSRQLYVPFFENLNGLRFIGAAAVFLFHCFTLGREIRGDFFHSGIFKPIASVFSRGHHGVGLFFVLSGFLITYLILHEAKERGQVSAKAFFMRRLLRIWPLYFLIVGFGFLVFPHLPSGIQTSNSPVLYSLFLSNFEEIFNGWRDPVNFLSVTWSVSIEEQFYMSWVVLILLFPFFRRGKWFGWYFALLIAASVIYRFVWFESERHLYFHTLSVVSDLAIGGLLGNYFFGKGIPQWFRQLSRWKILMLYVFGCGLVLTSGWLFPERWTTIERLFLGSFFAFVIAEQVYCAHSFFKADRLPGFFDLGEISYGLYMYHCIVIHFVQQWFVSIGWTHSPLHFVLFILLSAVLTYLISRLSYRFIERPVLGLKRYFR